ncbi:MAG: altronate hydrolase [Flammeovirgaceae bacterium]|nr:altronate hydrolase [Flammeovirgaceae bacterium]MBR06788.1 altronate hydrolase [Rickettsiales bacterium]HCX24215.1 altronate hydrolase [Cytophagales bacterium]|tara:strand:- start:4394 stop:6043 length:1650 start_codon:yes stop_codon:yes gene_type:complete
MRQAITINDSDDVAVALTDLPAGTEVSVNGTSLTLKQSITAKHKFALQDFAVNDEVHMYGVVVGTAKSAIQQGEAITTANLGHKSESFSSDKQGEFTWQAPDVSRWQNLTFDGYHRKDGQVGTANYWLVFPLVFCENRNIETIKKAFNKALGFEKQDPYVGLVDNLVSKYESGQLQDAGSLSVETVVETKSEHRVFENIDGIRFLTHQGGCGGTRQDAEVLCRLLSGYINNPNVAGATVLSLGCQNAQIQMFQDAMDSINPNMEKPVIILDQQAMGTEKDLVKTAITKTFMALVEANQQTRQPAPLSKLTIGLECGGSDGFSGISANPSIGYTSDLVVALGGKAILSEFPELCGVEQELINRMGDNNHAEKFVDIMRRYEKAAVEAGSGFDMNPSPGNIKDGLITDAMKSAGAAKKGGTSPVADVLDYTEYANKPGLTLLCTPGNDVESTTGLAGSGANVILFTTGLGTPTGNPVTPVLKVSSNTKLAEKMPDIIDIDTGGVIRGEKSIEQMGAEILDHIIEIASGRKTAKAMDLEQFDFIPWKRGVSL